MEFRDRLNKIILSFTPYEINEVEFTEDMNLASKLGFTSINFIQLYMAIEAEFEISLNNNFFCNENAVKYSYLLDIVNDRIEEN